MKNILAISIVLFSSFAFAYPINPMDPYFNHEVCLSSRLNPKNINIRYLKQEALEALVMMNAPLLDEDSASRLTRSHQAYYNRLKASIRSNGQNLYSFELDKILNLSASCENAEAVLIDIIRTLK